PSPALDPQFLSNTTPTVDLQQFQRTADAGSGGGGSNETDAPTVSNPGVSDTLVSITSATAFSSQDTLIAANASADTLTANGFQDTLVAGNASADTLTASGFDDTLGG